VPQTIRHASYRFHNENYGADESLAREILKQGPANGNISAVSFKSGHCRDLGMIDIPIFYPLQSNPVPRKQTSSHYKIVADTIRKRILNGEYAIKPLPSERQLALEFDVSYMTVRRGLQILVKENMLVRQTNLRRMVKRARQGAKPHFNFGLLVPTFSSNNIELWRFCLERQTSHLPCNVRPILYMHWDDQVLVDALKGFDGVFLNPIPEPLPPAIAKELSEMGHPIVVLDEDYSVYGVPSIELFLPSFVQKLLDHLAECGHKKIGCLNTQPVSHEINMRINQWRYWMAGHGLNGTLASYPVKPHTDPMMVAYQVMDKIITDNKEQETAWLCTTAPAAMGAMGALLDHGLQPGKDIAICAINGENLAPLVNPPLTALEIVDPSPYLSICLDWMMQGGKEWQGPLLMTPLDVPLVVRDSTRPGAGRGFAKVPIFRDPLEPSPDSKSQAPSPK
jgi:DNA-binding LacI/PurR family transcriptional regulator